MGDDKHFDKVYGLDGAKAIQDFYDEWSDSYDQDVGDSGYATPHRCAQALVRTATPFGTPLLDFGCGTGISGAAFAEAGFTVLDGVDLSAEMLAKAEEKGVYRSLTTVQAEEPLPDTYDLIAAVGVVSAGAAPPEALDQVMTALRPGGRCVFSFNDHTLENPAYPARLRDWLDRGCTILFEEYGPHLPKRDMNSIVYVIEKP